MGIRRCRKSALLHQLLQDLTAFYYLNFVDTRLIDIKSSDFTKLEEVFIEEFGLSDTYMFDEIQNVNEWEIFVRSGLDREKKFVITGSNGSLLSRELGDKTDWTTYQCGIIPIFFF